MLLVGWAALRDPLLWTAVVIAVLLLPALATAVNRPFAQTRRGTRSTQHIRGGCAHCARAIYAGAAGARVAPLRSVLLLSRCDRAPTLWAHADLAPAGCSEWKPSSIVERQLEESHSTDLAAVYQTMWVAPAIAVLTWGR